MKQWIAMLLAMVLCFGLCGCGKTEAPVETPAETPEAPAPAVEEIAPVDETMVTVTISNAGELAVMAQTIPVTDLDSDGVISIIDALSAAHDTFYPDGAEGFGAEMTDYGMSIYRLWGEENGGSYGCYVNNASAFNLADPIEDGDYVVGYSYADLTAWSDAYAYFNDLVVIPGEVTLTLSAASLDANWNPVTLPLGNARILINGEATDLITDDTGSVTLTAEAGDIISATAEGMVLVPPVCVVVGQ